MTVTTDHRGEMLRARLVLTPGNHSPTLMTVVNRMIHHAWLNQSALPTGTGILTYSGIRLML